MSSTASEPPLGAVRAAGVAAASFLGRPRFAGADCFAYVCFAWMKDGDHSFKPRKSSGRTEDENLREAVDAIVGFLDRSAKTPEKNAGP
jgi:predicted alpha/beta-hydrolase family hydrolase